MYEEARKYAYSDLWLVNGAGHADSREVAGAEAYRDNIEEFLINSEVIQTDAEAA